MGTLELLLIIILVVGLLGAFPLWTRQGTLGYGPVGIVGVIVVIILVILVMRLV